MEIYIGPMELAGIHHGGVMARIEWQQSYATGIESIDTQHQQIIALINSLVVSVDKQDRPEVSETLSGLREYIHTHFVYEEHLLEQSGYKFTL